MDALKSLDFEVIRTERFGCTPDAVCEGLVAALADCIQREEERISADMQCLWGIERI